MGQSSRDDEVEELEERVETLESKLQKMLPGRREVLAGGAAAGAAALGFGVGSASADGHNDGDTQWGSDSNRDDYVIDHADANSVSTDDLLIGDTAAQFRLDGKIVVVAEGLGVSDAIDPSQTTTPIQDACDLISGKAGRVLLPPGTIEENQPLDPIAGGRVLIEGVSSVSSESTAGSEIKFTASGSTDNHGIILGDGNDDFTLRDVTVTGPGMTVTTGDAVHYVDHTRGSKFENVNFRAWGRDIFRAEETAKPFETRLDHVGGWDYQNGLLNFRDLGPGNSASRLRAHGGEFAIFQRTGQLTIDTLNIGGDMGDGTSSNAAVHTNKMLNIGQINFEPTSVGSNLTSIFYHRFENPVTIGSIQNHATVDYAMEFQEAGMGDYGPVVNNDTINNTVAQVVIDNVGRSRFHGVTGDISGSSSNTAPIHCLDGEYQ